MIATPVRLSADFTRCLGIDGRDQCRAKHQCARHLAIQSDKNIRRAAAWLCQSSVRGELPYFMQIVKGDSDAD